MWRRRQQDCPISNKILKYKDFEKIFKEKIKKANALV